MISRLDNNISNIYSRFFIVVIFPALISAIPLSDVQTTKIGAVAVTTTAEKPVENVKTTQTTVEQEVSENASVENTDSLPPLIFPTDQNKIVAQNATALKILQHSYQTEVMFIF